MPTTRRQHTTSSFPCSSAVFYLWIVLRLGGYRTLSQPAAAVAVLHSDIASQLSSSDHLTITVIIPIVGVVIVIAVTMFRNKRKDSAIRTLVAETLVLAKTHGYVEKIEHELEEELQRENKGPPNRVLAKWRHKGEKLLKNKYTLLTVAIFCVTECALILGELILDLHKVKDVLEAQEDAASSFVHGLHRIYPVHVPNTDVQITKIFDRILTSNIQWKDPYSIASNQSLSPLQHNNESRHRRSMEFNHNDNNINGINNNNNNVNTKTLLITSFDAVYSNANSGYNSNNSSSLSNNKTSSLRGHGVIDHQGSSSGSSSSSSSSSASTGDIHGTSSSPGGHSLEEEIAHALHMASITILSILVFQTILKALCAGSAFFQRKLETFDLCVVLISFVVDLVCMQIMPRYKIQDFVFILAFLLPWRVIRVVNSLVVAVQDHEHFRLKLIYGRKKKIVNSLRESEVKLQLFRAQCNALKRLCYNEGIEEAKVDQILMVEECVVTKAGKSKCKVKIDNSSVIVLNDKSDFPRLSPRPSILNLFDYGSRRKSMQPTSLSSNDREFFLKTNSKDSSKKSLGFLRTRTRSNSESGRGTLSSPDESGTRGQNSFGESAISGLNTPVLIDRKSSLNSPIIANHVKNILSSLEGGGCVPSTESAAYRYGRGSLDEGNKQRSRDSDGKEAVPARDNTMKNCGKSGSSDSTGRVDAACGGVHGSRGNGGGGTDGSGSNGGNNTSGCNRNGVGPGALPTLKSRRGSLQPQKRVDEDEDLNHYLHVPPYTTVSIHQDGGIRNGNLPTDFKSASETSFSSPTRNGKPAEHFTSNPFTLIPTTPTSATPMSSDQMKAINLATTGGTSNATQAIQTSSSPPPSSNTTQICLASIERDAKESTDRNQQMGFFPEQSGNHSSNESSKPWAGDGDNDISSHQYKQSAQKQPAGLKPKTFRTPSDIENENNLTTANDPSCNAFVAVETTPTAKEPLVSYTHLHANIARHSSITEESETPETEKEEEIMV